MKGKILGLLAVGLLAGSIPAQAAFMYSLQSTQNSTAFVLTTASLISDTTTFAPSEFDSITLAMGSFDSVTFIAPLGLLPEIKFNIGAGFLSYFWIVPFSGPGTYCAGGLGCERTAAIMTITQTSVPEPGTVALLGLGLAGLALTRRRKAH